LIDFPVWLRVSHLINVIFITLLIRSGIEILSAHPKLYTSDNAIDGKEWIKFTKKKMPKDRLWTSMDEEESFSSWIALPGRNNLGLGRHWHFFSIIFWIGNGVVFYILLFATGLWKTLIPTSWSFFPEATKTMLAMATGHLPPPGNPFDPAQQLAYAGVIFVLGPLMLLTGSAMSPAVGARFPWYPKIFRGRQVARSIHFLCLIGFILFIIMHITLVLVDNFQVNMSNIIFGGGEVSLIVATILFLLYFIVVIVIHVWATEHSLRRPRQIQVGLDKVIAPVKHALFGKVISRQNFKESEISPYFRVNGYPPKTEEYKELVKSNFSTWKLRVYGSVEKELNLSLEDLVAMRKEVQITEHSCIQGWTSIGKWGGVPMSYILTLCKPLLNARYVAFHSLGNGDRNEYGHGDPDLEFYEVIDLKLAMHHQTILAYEMNGKPLPVEHGAPIRLRVETQLGFKMVKWLRSIEIVEDYRTVGEGLGGYRENVQYFGVGASI
jgi:DMSO/TMAO reductase YedYZ molybdopterin-dependent catalytic subunit/thiosulfate reductase cytochrome b subunit